MRSHLKFLGTILFALVFLTGGVLTIKSAQAADPTTVYDAIPNPLSLNMGSLSFQATQTSEFGDYVHLGGTNRILNTVTVTMSDWALHSAYPLMGAEGWAHPITLNIYNAVPGTPLNTKDSLIGTVTQTFTIPWRPAGDPSCPDTGYGVGFAWKLDGTCYNGLAFNVVFDLSNLNVTLPNDVIVGVAYNTQSYGAHPIGTAGPYNSLNVGEEGSATIGTDKNLDNVFWNTSTVGNYTDHGAGGVGIFREDTAWGIPSYNLAVGTLPMQITATPFLVMNGSNGYSTIQAAIAAATAGDIINVAAGTYSEQIQVTKKLTINGSKAGISAGVNAGTRGAEESIINGGFYISTAADGTVIDGFTVQSGYNDGGHNNGFTVESSGTLGITIQNNIIKDVTSPTQSNGIETVTGANNLKIINNNINNNFRGMYLNPSSGVQITGNVINSNNGGGGVGIASSGQSNMTVTGNTISNNSAEGWGMDNVGTGVVAYNNSFISNGAGVNWYTPDAGNKINAINNWWGNASGPDVVGPGTGDKVSLNVTFDPWYTDAGMTTLSNAPVAPTPSHGSSGSSATPAVPAKVETPDGCAAGDKFSTTTGRNCNAATPAVPAGKVLGAEKFNFTLFVKNGSNGSEIIELQKFLNTLGYTLTADGKFGPKTKAAVIKFQIANGLKGDGIIGALTRAFLNK